VDANESKKRPCLPKITFIRILVVNDVNRLFGTCSSIVKDMLSSVKTAHAEYIFELNIKTVE